MGQFDRIDLLCARRTQDAIGKYGCLDLKDHRNFIGECKEEVLDAINYIRFAMARADIGQTEGKAMVFILKGVYGLLHRLDNG